jgi:hypothetical protein
LFGSVGVEMSQCGAYAAAILNRPFELTGSAPRLSWFIFDPFTVLAGSLGPGAGLLRTAGITPTSKVAGQATASARDATCR